MSVVDESILAVLERRAVQQPDDIAYTFVDYDVDPSGFAESLTWSQVYNRVCVMANELRKLGAVGDRAAIMAPQGLDYIVGFLGALEAGLVAVPLSVPMLGVHDERASAVLRDCTPSVVLTTSSVVDAVMPSLSGVPAIIEVDALDLDSPAAPFHGPREQPKTAFLQYTSGSTRTPAGVMVTHESLIANLTQIEADYFEDTGGVAPPDTTFVSWLPFYHDMGLILGIFGPVGFDMRGVLTSPMAFLQKPFRWIHLMATSNRPVTAAPNFAYELAVRRTSDDDMVGLDLAHVSSFMTGAERVHAATMRRFYERFSKFNLPATALRAAYGLAEATVYVASSLPGRKLSTVRFDYEKLADSYAVRCEGGAGVELIGHGAPRACTVRIVDPETGAENPPDKVGEIWVCGENVSAGYWRNPQATERTFGAELVDPSPGTPQGPWLRTGDLGVLSDGELFIIGRIKDLLIVDGRNHYPDDIEATIQEISGGRVAAISVQDDRSEQLVAIVEFKNRGGSADAHDRMHTVKRELMSAISRSHGVRVSDLVMVAPGSIPITTSGKIRRSSCIELYGRDGFARLDTAV
ncbi:AMP-binding protein [Mycolicibacterium mengxianglii]|uniref:AMP-binding protein n=1 Tax=Mycolicibacterium mengxianglii TaxID=2736649 RepID=UPI0018D1CB63|nr:AMP-binding protein [Mycolicibacterium mengxianglii]